MSCSFVYVKNVYLSINIQHLYTLGRVNIILSITATLFSDIGKKKKIFLKLPFLGNLLGFAKKVPIFQKTRIV